MPESKYTGNTKKLSDLSGNIMETKNLIFNNINTLELKPWALSIGEGNNPTPERQVVLGIGFFKGLININRLQKESPYYL